MKEQHSSGCSSLSQVELTIRNAANVQVDGDLVKSAKRIEQMAYPWKCTESASLVREPKCTARVHLGLTTQPANKTAMYIARK